MAGVQAGAAAGGLVGALISLALKSAMDPSQEKSHQPTRVRQSAVQRTKQSRTMFCVTQVVPLRGNSIRENHTKLLEYRVNCGNKHPANLTYRNSLLTHCVSRVNQHGQGLLAEGEKGEAVGRTLLTRLLRCLPKLRSCFRFLGSSGLGWAIGDFFHHAPGFRSADGFEDSHRSDIAERIGVEAAFWDE